MNALLDQLGALSSSEKLQIVEQLWDEIGASREPIVVRDWHRAEGTRRAAELEANPDIAITREELWKRVNERDA